MPHPRPFLLMFLLLMITAGCGESGSSGTSGSGGVIPNTPIPAIVPDDERGYATPQAAWEAYAKAQEKHDARAMMHTMTLDSQRALAGETMISLSSTRLLGALTNIHIDDQLVRALFARHGIAEVIDLSVVNELRSRRNIEQLKNLQLIGGHATNPAWFVVEANGLLTKQSGVEHGFSESKGEPGNFTVDGNAASVTVRFRRGRKNFELTRSATGWLIHLTKEWFQPFGRTVSGSRVRFNGQELSSLPPVAAISVERVRNDWKQSVNYQQIPALDALQDIAEKGGLQILDQRNLQDILRQPITLQQQDVSVVQVIEAICTQVGLHPRYNRGNLALGLGPRRLPATFSGPFIIECIETFEAIPNARGQITLQCFAAGLPQQTTSCLNGVGLREHDGHPRSQLGFEMQELTSQDGTKLPTSKPIQTYVSASHRSVSFCVDIYTSHLLNSVTHIGEFDGEISWSFPVRGEFRTVEAPDSDPVVRIGDATVKVSYGGYITPTVILKVSGVPREQVVVSILDEHGWLVPGSQIEQYEEEEDLMRIDSSDAIDGLHIGVVEEFGDVSFSFRMPQIPLAHHDQMPVTLDPAVFEGETPVTAEFTGMEDSDFYPDAKIRWKNHSNKDVQSVDYHIEYLGANGEMLEEDDKTHRAFGTTTPLLSVESPMDTHEFGFTAVEGTASVRVTVKAVTFVDTTNWPAAGEDGG